MTTALVLLGLLTLASAGAAVMLRNLVHAALFLVSALGGLAGLYLVLGAQFIGLAQVLVYIGAVAVIILFAVLLTRGTEPSAQPLLSAGWVSGLIVALAVFVTFGGIFSSSDLIWNAAPQASRSVTVKELGNHLMVRHALSLQVIGLLLTAALIGAVLLAMRDKPPAGSGQPPQGGNR